jgi:uncharacterized membrane protein required for colicin V production
MTPLALDIAVAAIILLSTLAAFFRGIIREFFTLAGFILAVFVAYKAGHLLVPSFDKWFGVTEGAGPAEATILGVLTPAMASKVASYGSIFLLIFILMIVIRILISRWIKDAGLSVVDRVIGGLFGFARGFLLVFIVYAGALYLAYLGDAEKFPDWVKKSVSAPMLQDTLEWTKKHFDLDKVVESTGDGINIKLDKIDFDKAGEAAGEAVQELKENMMKEESGAAQPSPPEAAPAPEAPVPPAPEPYVAPAPAPEQAVPDNSPPPAPEPAPEPAPVPEPAPPQ